MVSVLEHDPTCIPYASLGGGELKGSMDDEPRLIRKVIWGHALCAISLIGYTNGMVFSTVLYLEACIATRVRYPIHCSCGF